MKLAYLYTEAVEAPALRYHHPYKIHALIPITDSPPQPERTSNIKPEIVNDPDVHLMIFNSKTEGGSKSSDKNNVAYAFTLGRGATKVGGIPNSTLYFYKGRMYKRLTASEVHVNVGARGATMKRVIDGERKLIHFVKEFHPPSGYKKAMIDAIHGTRSDTERYRELYQQVLNDTVDKLNFIGAQPAYAADLLQVPRIKLANGERWYPPIDPEEDKMDLANYFSDEPLPDEDEFTNRRPRNPTVDIPGFGMVTASGHSGLFINKTVDVDGIDRIFKMFFSYQPSQKKWITNTRIGGGLNVGIEGIKL